MVSRALHSAIAEATSEEKAEVTLSA
jgi:hypothetical protein